MFMVWLECCDTTVFCKCILASLIFDVSVVCRVHIFTTPFLLHYDHDELQFAPGWRQKSTPVKRNPQRRRQLPTDSAPVPWQSQPVVCLRVRPPPSGQHERCANSVAYANRYHIFVECTKWELSFWWEGQTCSTRNITFHFIGIRKSRSIIKRPPVLCTGIVSEYYKNVTKFSVDIAWFCMQLSSGILL